VIVLDASAALELLLGTSRGASLRARLLRRRERLCAPHLIDIEVAHALRRYERAGEIGSRRAEAALTDLAEMPIVRYPHTPLLERIWQLRANLTGYDTAYLALAEILGAPLLTCDAKLATAPGHRARVEVMD
jgi:predicted nucleic acid-binding protein